MPAMEQWKHSSQAWCSCKILGNYLITKESEYER
jgi:hypothetical protein